MTGIQQDAGSSGSTIRMILAGKATSPMLDTAIAIADTLGVSILEAARAPRDQERLDEMRSLAARLDREGLRAVLPFARFVRAQGALDGERSSERAAAD